MSTTFDRPSTGRSTMQAPRDAARAPETWIGAAFAARRFARPVAPVAVPPVALPVERQPAASVPGPAFRAAARPKRARYLAFGDRDHLLRYVRARAEIRS